MKRWFVLLACAVCAFAQEDDGGAIRYQARSMVMTKYGIVSASQTLAAAAGSKVLEAGGSAIDAAIAANATLGLVEPTGNGMGGDLFAIIYEAKTGKVWALNSSGWSPMGMTPEFLASKGVTGRVPNSGIYSVTVPGAVAGWDAMHKKFGKLPWGKLFDPAITYAQEGFPVTELISDRWHRETRKFGSEEAKRIWLLDGKVPEAGQWFKNPDLAKSLKMVQKEGRDGFYRGPIAEAIVKISGDLGGAFTLADLAEFQPEWVEPISTNYRGWDVYEIPPNSQGIAALSMLNIMELYPLGEFGHNSTQALHVMIEAKKLAYADMLKYTGDLRFSQAPVSAMLSEDLAAKHAAQIGKTANCMVTPAELSSIAQTPGADTIYMASIDAEGNMVSLIQSNYSGFGSGVVPAGAGFMLQNRGGLFTLEPNHPNTLAGHKRPLHTIIPAFMSKGDTKIAFGIMGGWNQAQAHAQYVANIVDYGMNIQAAMEAARFTKGSFDGCDVTIESRVPDSVVSELKALGHELEVTTPYSPGMGGGQVTMQDGKGVHFGASDPRKDGAAVPQSPSFWP